MDMEKSVLIIEDDIEQGTLLASFLENRNYQVLHVKTGKDALATEGPFGFILLDLNLPDTDGISLFSPLKQKFPDSFIVMLTARKEEVDRILGLEIGADDYLSKPYSLRELEARLRTILRRQVRTPKSPQTNQNRLLLHPETCRASLKDASIEFTAQEFRVIQLLYSQPRRIFSREQIMANCWGQDVYVTDRVVDAMIARIRKKLKATFSESFIFTKHGLGYGFDETP